MSLCLTMNPFLFFFHFFPANEQAGTELMLFAHFAQLIKDLQSQLPGRGDDKGPKTIQRTPFEPIQLFQHLCMQQHMPINIQFLVQRATLPSKCNQLKNISNAESQTGACCQL